MTKGHNQEDQKKPNAQKGAKTVNAKQQNADTEKGRKAENPETGKGKNSIK